MTWLELLRRYEDHLAQLGQARTTVESCHRWLARFAESCRRQGVRHPGALTREHLAVFQRELSLPNGIGGGLLSPSSQLQALTVVRQCLRWATRRGHLLMDPSQDLVLRARPRPLRRVPSQADLERLLATPSAHTPFGLRDRAILDLFYSTGLRLGECHRLNLEDLDRPQQLVVVRRGKGGKARLVPLLPVLAQTLERYLAEGRPRLRPAPQESALWLDRRGQRLASVILARLVARHGRAAGLAPLSPHRLRHAFAVHLLEGGAELAVIQALLGHVDPRTTEIYTRTGLLALTREYRRTHPRA